MHLYEAATTALFILLCVTWSSTELTDAVSCVYCIVLLQQLKDSTNSTHGNQFTQHEECHPVRTASLVFGGAAGSFQV